MSLWSSLRQRNRFKLEAVVLDVGADRVLHRLDEGGALLLQLFEVHGGGDRTQAVDEFRLDQLAQFGGIVGAAAQRLRGQRDRGGIGFDADVEFGADIDAHAVLGDQRVRAAAGDLEPQCLQIDGGGGMENRQHERAAVEHDLLAAEAGADIGLVTGRTPVEFRKQEADNKNDEDANSDGYCKFPHFYALSDAVLLCNEVGWCGNGDEALGVAVDQQHAGADRKGSGIGAGARRRRVCQLPKTSLRRTRPGNPWSSGPIETSATWPTKSASSTA